MLESVKKFWRSISYLGIKNEHEFVTDDLKNRIFFNRCLFVGSFSLLGTAAGSWPFIGYYTLLNLVTNLAIIIALILQVKGYFGAAKRIVVYTLFAVGLVLTSISGGDFLYHTGIITVLTFAWIMFDPKKDLIELILFCLLAVIGYLIGELNPFGAPDFTNHPSTPVARISNLIGYTGVSLIFISFIRNLNRQYEEKLSETVAEKDQLIQEVKVKTKALEDESVILEEQISHRTSELFKQKEKLASQNTEKEVLLKEIHHRVKNNLQIIVSLLNLQANRFEDAEVLEAIQETQNRIISMSLVHQRMYQTADFVAIEFKDYTDLLFENIRTLVSYKEKVINYTNSIPSDLTLDIETAIPLGLVINEMISNSFKHAFTETQENNDISISIKVNEENYALVYKDNGIGFPESLDIESTDSLGLQLITALAEQINGDLNYYTDKGAIFEITFPISKN